MKYGCLQLSLLIITSVSEISKIPKSNVIISCSSIQAIACFDRFDFLKVDVVNPTHTQYDTCTVFVTNNRPVSNSPRGEPNGDYEIQLRAF